MRLNKNPQPIMVFLVLMAAFFLVPFSQTNLLSTMPGDLGDARLVNYFLENIYHFFAGRSSSLWHLGFFSPFPYILGLSENLFGSAPVYLVARFFTRKSDSAFQVWYLFGYFVNFFAAYYALGKLGNTRVASVVGALIFAFALPVTARSGHAQLHYRFATPLSIAMFVFFLDRKEWRFFVVSSAWLVWQFYCGVYIGFFTLLTLSVIFFVYVFRCLQSKEETLGGIWTQFAIQWHVLAPRVKLSLVCALVFLLALLVLLFYPYLMASRLYGPSRSLAEIASMLPRPQSYFLSDGSWLWSSPSKIFDSIPMRHEHQMFIGAIPMLLALFGVLVGGRARNGSAFVLLGSSLATLMVLTLYTGGLSLWFLFATLPLASAIRAMTRIVLVLLFSAAYLAAVAVDFLRNRAEWVSRLLFVVVIPLMIFEFSATTAPSSLKRDWRQRLVHNDAAFPHQLPPDPIVFFAQTKGPFYASELDAMWVALNNGVPTLNGYSSFFPPGFRLEYGNDCSEVPRRVLSYLVFIGREGDQEAYLNLMRRVVPIGFEGCDEEWTKAPLSLTTTNRKYTADEFRRLSLAYLGKSRKNSQWVVDFKILNSSDLRFSAISSVGNPIRFSWRFLDPSGTAVTGWDTRFDLPFDIGPNNWLRLKVQVDPKREIKGGSLQISLVQEHVFWGHEIGVSPLKIPWD